MFASHKKYNLLIFFIFSLCYFSLYFTFKTRDNMIRGRFGYLNNTRDN